MRLLVGLRPLEAIRRVGEISAAVLTVCVEEGRVELVGEVVMVSDIAPGPFRRVPAEETLDRSPPPLAEHLARLTRILPAIGAGNNFEEIENGAVLDDQAAVHISL